MSVIKDFPGLDNLKKQRTFKKPDTKSVSVTNHIDKTEFEITLDTIQVISETVFPTNLLTATGRTEPNYNQIQLTTQ